MVGMFVICVGFIVLLFWNEVLYGVEDFFVFYVKVLCIIYCLMGCYIKGGFLISIINVKVSLEVVFY